jgi:hypothetical protein
MDKTYFVTFKCTNCRVIFEIEFKFGIQRPADTEIECRNCGCYTCAVSKEFREIYK